jgi:hypothetical protein
MLEVIAAHALRRVRPEGRAVDAILSMTAKLA